MKIIRVYRTNHMVYRSCNALSSTSFQLANVTLIRIGELQADTIVRGYPLVRIASLRIHYSTPSRPSVASHEQAVLSRDLWGYVQEDSGADAFLRAIESTGWSGHETFMIVAPETWSNEDTNTLLQKFWSHI